MKILLTGAGGMVGQNILEHPQAKMHQWLCPRHSDLNLTNYTEVKRFLSQQKPDFVIHAAGKVGGIQANMREPVRFLIDNLDMGRNILLASAEIGIKQLINLGSSCMYPRNRQEALTEEDILTGALEPTNEGYALAKITVAKLAEYLNRENPELIYKTLIPCNLYGPYDKFDPRWSHMIPAVIHKLHQAKITGAQTVDIWGSGEACREFMYVGDLADVIFKAITNLDSMPEFMNIGLGYDYTVNEYYHVAAQVIGYQGSFNHDLTKPVGMNRKLNCVKKAEQWGWKATTTLEQGIAKTYQFYLKNLV